MFDKNRLAHLQTLIILHKIYLISFYNVDTLIVIIGQKFWKTNESSEEAEVCTNKSDAVFPSDIFLGSAKM